MAKKTLHPEEQILSLAQAALADASSPGEVGELVGVEQSDGVYTVTYRSVLPGYPGWNWVVTLSDGEGGNLGVLEMHLLPGDDALLAPEWVPWSERLEEYRRAEAERETEDSSDLDDDLDDDFDDDLDGVDIDQLDLDPAGLEIPDEPNDVFDHVEVDD